MVGQTNHLLAAMPADVIERLSRHIEKVTLIAGEVLYSAGANVTHLYFPVDLIVMMLLPLSDGTTSKVAIVGHEGVVGISVFMGSATSLGRAVVLTRGKAFKISATALQSEFDRSGAAMRLLLRFTQSVATQMAQTIVCNRHHHLEQQLCSLLLACMDRTPTGCTLAVTQEIVAGLLGVRRAGISEAASTLRELGLITSSRGRIRMLDRAGLQNRACECYQVVKRETDRLLTDLQGT